MAYMNDFLQARAAERARLGMTLEQIRAENARNAQSGSTPIQEYLATDYAGDVNDQRRAVGMESWSHPGLTNQAFTDFYNANPLPEGQKESFWKDFILNPGVLMTAGYGLAGGLSGAFNGVNAATPAPAAANAGSMMPAAVPESAATLAEWGLTQTAPGVWSAAAPAGAAGAGAAAAGGSAGSAGGASGAAGGTAGTAGTAAASASIFDKVLANPSLLGLGAGALLGGMGGSEQTGTMTTEEGLPDWLKAYAKPALDQYGTQLQNYNVDPYGIMPAAGQQFRDTIGGVYLDPSTNKYLTDYFNAGAERIKGTVSPSFGHMQAFGSHTGYNEALSRGLGDFATGLYGGNYAKERDRQTTMTAAAPDFLQSQSQAAFAPYQSYLNTISGLGKKKEQPFYENKMGNMLGGAMAGYGLGGLFK